ncbi:probable cytochrome P450 6a14 [Rhodnius prolixus]|uniref:Putative cytochrome n=1 Tax=Rhodnius prolixus TaxID=13249 RepID=R4G4V1_RHOPR
MMDLTSLLVSITISLVTFAVYKAWRKNRYWQERGVPHRKPWLFLGNKIVPFLTKKTGGELIAEMCKEFPNSPYIGGYDFMKPILLITDLDIIENILIKDFMHFTDRGFNVDFKNRPFDSNLFLMSGKHWRAVRHKLSPLFTTGKLRMMFDSMKQCGDQLVEQLEAANRQEIEMKEYLRCFAVDVIGSCAFGIDAGTLANPKNEFHKMAKKIFKLDLWQIIRLILLTTFTPIARLFNISINKRDVRKYFCNIIDETLKYRRETEFRRNDFVQMMMQLQSQGYVEIQTKDPADYYLGMEQSTYTTWKYEMSDEEITGHAFTFLSLGFDTLLHTMLFALYEFAKNLEIQEKARQEILIEMKSTETMTYQTLKEMTYLEQCVKETLRKYPPAQVLIRVCTKDYTLPDGFKIQRGQRIMIPIIYLHVNPNIYPEPERFQPERFDPDSSLHSCAFLPFGNGPRICIAMRFAMLEIKYCLAKLLMNYRFQINNKTKEPLTLNPKALLTEPNENIIFNITKIE